MKPDLFRRLERWLTDIRDGRVHWDSQDFVELEKLLRDLRTHERAWRDLTGGLES